MEQYPKSRVIIFSLLAIGNIIFFLTVFYFQDREIKHLKSSLKSSKEAKAEIKIIRALSYEELTTLNIIKSVSVKYDSKGGCQQVVIEYEIDGVKAIFEQNGNKDLRLLCGSDGQYFSLQIKSIIHGDYLEKIKQGKFNGHNL